MLMQARRVYSAWILPHSVSAGLRPFTRHDVIRRRTIPSVGRFCRTEQFEEEALRGCGSSYKRMALSVKYELERVHLQWLFSSDHHLDRGQFKALFRRFCKSVTRGKGSEDMRKDIVLVASKKRDVEVLKPYFLSLVARYYPEVTHLERLRELSDLSSPAQWFPAARELNRRFIYHSGPTNSGKTYEALKRYSSATSGVYCAPLRMLATEIYLRCNAQDVPCDLLTGEERVLVGEFESPHLSCTVEMASTGGSRLYDVGIIDEVQMLADEERGSAWTRVILGLNAREIHLCGNPSALDIVKRILSTTGETLEVREYERLSPLIPTKNSLYDSYKNIKEGDCVVTFSRRRIFSIKKQIEESTGLRCAVIYGGLPPVTRIQQAKLFNDPHSKYKVLVASDAIGMGLNLNIKRVVFSTLEKRKGPDIYPLSSTHVKQIAGRAGRYLSQYPRGEVTTLKKKDVRKMMDCLEVEENSIQQAGLSPNFEQIQMFSDVLPHATLDEIFDLFEQLATLDGFYFLCDFEDNKKIARELKEFNLSLFDLYTFSFAPIDTREDFLINVIKQFAYVYSKGKSITYNILQFVLQWPPSASTFSPEKLRTFELFHEVIDLYLWLGMRYPDYFPDTEEAKKLQKSVEKVINQSLSSTLGSRGPSRRQRESAEIRTPKKSFLSSPRTNNSSHVSGRLKSSKKYRRVLRRRKAHKRSYMRRKYFK